jgi:CBS domain containing-hemolysin-like protein
VLSCRRFGVLVTALTLLKLVYAVSGGIVIAAYLPQVRAAWGSVTGAHDVSLTTWSVWTGTSLVSLLYAHFVTGDIGFTLVSVGNLSGCALVTACVIYRRLRPARPVQPRVADTP